MILPGCAVLVALGSGLQGRAQDVLTFHNDNQRSGVQGHETSLTPANVHPGLFGKVFTFAVEGDVYAQPLYVSQRKMADGKLHNLLIVATARDWVYAFDADGKNPKSGYLWRVSLLGRGETWVSSSDVNTTDIDPDIGIIGTPAVDSSQGAVYVVSKSKTKATSPVFRQRLHALNLVNGAEVLKGPTLIEATVAGSGDGGSTVSFDPLRNNERCALLLAETPKSKSVKTVFIAWASHGDNTPYHGWVLGYDAADITKQTAAWVDTPNGGQGGIWMSAGGLAVDSLGHIFGASGNGDFDADSGGSDFSETLFELTPGSKGVTLSDWFTPVSQSVLTQNDQDFGVGGVPLVLPDQTGPVPHLILTADKSGQIYVLNRDRLGHFRAQGNPDVQDVNDGGFAIHSNLVFFNNNLYLAPDSGPVEQWAFHPKSGLFDVTPTAVSSHQFTPPGGADGGGSNFTISANGVKNAIVWAIDYTAFGSGPAVLYAFEASNVANELYDSTQAGSRDAAAVAVKFSSPTVAGGRVYVGGRNAITVYGLLPAGKAKNDSLN